MSQIKDFPEQTTIVSTDRVLEQTAGNITKFFFISTLTNYLKTLWQDTSNNFVGLTLFKINFKNAADTFTSFLTNANTAARTYTFKDYDCTIPGLVSDNLILKSIAGAGIKVDEASPGYGYADLKGHKTVPTSGGTAPQRTQFRTGVYAPGYDTNDVIDWEFHLEHGDMIGETYYQHLHLKIPEGCVASGNNLVITCVNSISFHNRTGSPAPITKVFTITPAQINAVTNGTLIPTEILIAQAGGNDITEFNSSNWRIDDDITSSCTFTSIPTLTGGLGQRIGMGHHDFHRKVSGTGVTKYREMATTGSFYGTT